MGQRLIKPIVEPVLFTAKDNHLMKMSKETVERFQLTEQDLQMTSGSIKHRFNHVKQNMELASKFQQFKNLQ